MPGQRCAVATCQSVHGKHKVSFFTIPKRKDIRSKWIIACKRKEKFNPDTSRVCSMHFREDDYKLDYRSALLNTQIRRPRSLKPTAVPTVHLRPDHSEEMSPRDQRMQRRNRKILVQSLLQQSSEENTISESEVQPERPIEQDRFENLFGRYNVIFVHNNQLIEQCVESRKEINEDQKMVLKIELDSDVKTEPIFDLNTEESLPLESSGEMISTKQEQILIDEPKIEVEEFDNEDEHQVKL